MRKIKLLILLFFIFNILGVKKSQVQCSCIIDHGEKVSRIVAAGGEGEAEFVFYTKNLFTLSEEKCLSPGHSQRFQNISLDDDEFIIGVFGNPHNLQYGPMPPYTNNFGYITTKRRIQLKHNPYISCSDIENNFHRPVTRFIYNKVESDFSLTTSIDNLLKRTQYDQAVATLKHMACFDRDAEASAFNTIKTQMFKECTLLKCYELAQYYRNENQLESAYADQWLAEIQATAIVEIEQIAHTIHALRLTQSRDLQAIYETKANKFILSFPNDDIRTHLLTHYNVITSGALPKIQDEEKMRLKIYREMANQLFTEED